MYGTLSNRQPKSVTPDKVKCVCLQGNKTKDGFDQLAINEKTTTIRDVGIFGCVQCAKTRRKERLKKAKQNGLTGWAKGRRVKESVRAHEKSEDQV